MGLRQDYAEHGTPKGRGDAPDDRVQINTDSGTLKGAEMQHSRCNRAGREEEEEG